MLNVRPDFESVADPCCRRVAGLDLLAVYTLSNPWDLHYNRIYTNSLAQSCARFTGLSVIY